VLAHRAKGMVGDAQAIVSGREGPVMLRLPADPDIPDTGVRVVRFRNPCAAALSRNPDIPDCTCEYIELGSLPFSLFLSFSVDTHAHNLGCQDRCPRKLWVGARRPLPRPPRPRPRPRPPRPAARRPCVGIIIRSAPHAITASPVLVSNENLPDHVVGKVLTRPNGSGAGGSALPVRCGIAVRGEWPSAARSATGRASVGEGQAGFNSFGRSAWNRAWRLQVFPR
jgi:hypothetical protein